MRTSPYQKNRSTYDQIAPRFAAINACMPEVLASFGEQFLSLVPPGTNILDLGCGSGRDMAWFEARGAAVTGADLSKGMLAEARRVTKGPLFQSHILQLCFESQAFGAVWCNAALLHIPKADISQALNEIGRVLLPGGILAASVKQGECEVYEPWPIPADKPMERYFAYYSKEELRRLLESAGFTVLDTSANAVKQVTWLWFFCRKA